MRPQLQQPSRPWVAVATTPHVISTVPVVYASSTQRVGIAPGTSAAVILESVWRHLRGLRVTQSLRQTSALTATYRGSALQTQFSTFTIPPSSAAAHTLVPLPGPWALREGDTQISCTQCTSLGRQKKTAVNNIHVHMLPRPRADRITQ